MAVAAPRARPAPKPVAAPRVARPAATSRSRPVARRAATSPALARWTLWIAIVAVLLAGIVALNVAALELRVERGKVQSQNADLRAGIERLEAQLSGAAAVSPVEAAARGRLGLTESAETVYLGLERAGR